MSSLHLTIVYTLLALIVAENRLNFFSKSSYDLWCEENLLHHGLFLYPSLDPIGIRRTSNIKSVTYQLLNDQTNGLFQIKSKRLGDFYFLIFNLTRPLDINREYQDVYRLEIQANVVTTQDNQTEQVEIRVHVADSNDNDGVFDMDIYEQNYTRLVDVDQRSLVRFHASDADEIQHAQIFYELVSSLNETFSLHPLTGELILINRENLQSNYEFDVYAFDRYRKRFVDNNMKTKTHVKLNFLFDRSLLKIQYERFQTFDNKTIELQQHRSSHEINIVERHQFNLLNIHQSILTIDIQPRSLLSSVEIFLLANSSSNVANFFLHRNELFFNRYSVEEYQFSFLLAFNQRSEYQLVHYRYFPSIDWNISQLFFPIFQPITIDENLPVDTFITRVELQSHRRLSSSIKILYKLLNDDKHLQFYLHSQTGILRLAERLQSTTHRLDIQANIQLFNRRYSLETSIDIVVREVNKYPPKFSPEIPREFYQLPYQFHADDLDQNRQSNGRVSYRLNNCSSPCPFRLDPNNGTLTIRSGQTIPSDRIFDLQIVAFDWGEPISLASRLPIRIELSPRASLVKRDLMRTRTYSRRWKKKFSASFITSTVATDSQSIETSSMNPTETKTVDLNIGFARNFSTYRLSESTELYTVIDRLRIEHDSFPLSIDDEKDNLFFYTINDTDVPFLIDQTTKNLLLIDHLDREQRNQYVFEIELKFKSIYAQKLREDFSSPIHFQYTKKFYQKILVIIFIDDVNDNIPRCLSSHVHVTIEENQLKSNVYRVQAFDPDSGENGTIVYSFLESTPYFSINSSTGQIDCIQSIDYEQISTMNLYVIASDRAVQMSLQSICMTVHITIDDINDHSPQFSLGIYQFDLFFDMPRYSIFGQIFAIDLDRNDRLNYSLDPNPYLFIHPSTGHLRLKHHLHRLIDQIFNVTVKVSDGLHRNQTSIFIHVKSFVDAQQPILLPEPAYGVTINESLTINTLITNIYRRFQLSSSTIDFVEIINDQYPSPFTIDSQGSVRLSQSLIGVSKTSYWLPIRLTRYRAHPPHSFFHLHISIRAENLHLPQCVDLYQNVQVYDYLVQYPFARIQAISFNKNSPLQYNLIDQDSKENQFSLDKQTGFLYVLPTIINSHRMKSDYFLTIQAMEQPSKLSVQCYIKVHLIRRRQLIPRFVQAPIYRIDLPELDRFSGRLRQRLFQIIALLENHQVYSRKIEIRYRMIDVNAHFIINRQTGYVAAKQPLKPQMTYEFKIEAFTVAYRDDILIDGNEQDDDEQNSRGKGRVISSRVILPVKVRILPKIRLEKSPLSTIDSTINIDVLSTAEVGSTIVHLGMNNRVNLNQTQWFILISHIRYTRYFHVDFQTGQLILLRPIDELINQTNPIELRINVTNDWVHMNTIKVLLRLVHHEIPSIHFAQSDYYSSISKNIPIGVEFARVTIENGAKDCRYSIDSVEQIKSVDLFRIDSLSGSVIVNQSLESSLKQTHVLTIVYRCDFNYQLASTKLHVQILDEKISRNQTKKSYRFSQEHYLVLFETSLGKGRRKTLMNFQWISDDDSEQSPIKSQAKILRGDPLGLFSIDSNDQSLIFLDESLARSYEYPMNLTIVDVTQSDSISCTVTIFITNVGIHFPCPSYFKASPYLFTYESLPATSIDYLTGVQYSPYQSVLIHGFDPFTPINGEASNYAECQMARAIETSNVSTSVISQEFLFDSEVYQGFINESFGTAAYIYTDEQQPIQLHAKTSMNLTHPFDITYHLINQTDSHYFNLDEYAGLMKYQSFDRLLSKYSFLIMAKYRSLFTLTRLNVAVSNDTLQQEKSTLKSIYEFQLLSPFVDNSTIGYLNVTRDNLTILNEHIRTMIGIDNQGRLFIQNRTLILANGNFYDFLIHDEYEQMSRIRLTILPSTTNTDCQWTRFDPVNDPQLIGYLELDQWNSSRPLSFSLLNHRDLFQLNRQYGLLTSQKGQYPLDQDYLLLIEIDQRRCLIHLERRTRSSTFITLRNESQLYREFKTNYVFDQSSSSIQLTNGTLIHLNILSSRAPIFNQLSYEFTLNLTKQQRRRFSIGQVIAEPYDANRSRLVYQLVTPQKHFRIDFEQGYLEYLSDSAFNKTREDLQISARDLIYGQNTTVNVTIHIHYVDHRVSLPLISYQNISEIRPPGSVIYQLNLSSTDSLRYSLLNNYSNQFRIDPISGRITLLKYLSRPVYSLKLQILPWKEISWIQFQVNEYNRHPPHFLNLPQSLSLSSTDEFVTKLSAYDLDWNDHQRLIYYLLDHQDDFLINASNGLITRRPTSTLVYEDRIRLTIGVSDGLYLTKKYLQIHLSNYSQHSPRFASDENVFYYDQKTETIGQLIGHDDDPSDRLTYEIHLAPNGVEIDRFSGVMTMTKGLLFRSSIEFVASVRDLAEQISYTKVLLNYRTVPTFDSNFYSITLVPSEMKVPMEIFQFELVDDFHQTLSSTRFRLNKPSNLFEIKQKKLFLNELLMPTKVYRLEINGFWKNFTVQTTMEIRVEEMKISLEKKSYQFKLDRSWIRENFLVERIPVIDMSMTIVPTPLTRNDCHRNFDLNEQNLIFKSQPILSDLCFFEIQVSNNVTIDAIQIQVAFEDSSMTPRFTSTHYRFNLNQHDQNFRVFALAANPLQYRLQSNSYGLRINQSNGHITRQSSVDPGNSTDTIKLFVEVIDEKTQVNQSVLVSFSSNPRKRFQFSTSFETIELCPNVPIRLSDQSLPGTVIQDIRLNVTQKDQFYYIFSGDSYGLFALNTLGQLYLTSPMLNRTKENQFPLIILISSFSSISYCRTTVSIDRTSVWSNFLCPMMPIEWRIEEESPIGTIVGTAKDTLAILNNGSQLLDEIQFKFHVHHSDTQAFFLNTKTGVLTSNGRLDYEQQSSYSFSIDIEPEQVNCSIPIVIELLNIADNSIRFENKSLFYNVTEHSTVPMYIGRLKLIDIDQLFVNQYEFSMSNVTDLLSIDRTTGSIILKKQLDREVHGAQLVYEIVAQDYSNREKSLSNVLSISINDINDHGARFFQSSYAINISKSLRPGNVVFQVNATSADPEVNGQFIYSLVNGNDHFLIDDRTGIIRLKQLIPSETTNLTVTVQVKEEGIDQTDFADLLISVINDNNAYFNFTQLQACSLEEHQPIGTHLCSVGRNTKEFFYQMIDPNSFFRILENNGTIINTKVFDYEMDPHEFMVTIIVKDRENQSIELSSLNVTITLRNINDHQPKLLSDNATTLIYLYYPSINTVLHQIELIDKDLSNFTFEIINSTSPFLYALHSIGNSSEIFLKRSIENDREDHLIIRIHDDNGSSVSNIIDVHLHLMFLQQPIDLPEIYPQTIDGYIQLEDQISSINLGSLLAINSSSSSILYDLVPHEHFFLKEISLNQTELHFKPMHPSIETAKARVLQFQLQLSAISVPPSIITIPLNQKRKFFLPAHLQSQLKIQTVEIHLWPIDREMLDRSLTIYVNLRNSSTYEQFLVQTLPVIRENLAQIIGVQLRHVHLYTFEQKGNDQIELLLAIIRYPSRLRPPRYIHKKLLYNALKNFTHLFETIPHVKSIEKILLNQCQSKSCEHNGRCTSHLKLLDQQYEYFSSQFYRRLIPKYQWNIKCLCLNNYHGVRCQYKQDYQSPCTSNPCSATERCIEESPNLYTCQCVDEPCHGNEMRFEKTFDCMNINSPTCRDTSNTLTFDGYSYVRMNLTGNLTQHTNLSFTFRTQVAQGKFFRLVFIDEKKKQQQLTVQMVDGRVNIELNEKILFEITEISVHDGLWHSIEYSLDYSSLNHHYYHLVRLDRVFSNRLEFYQAISFNRIEQLIVGNDFHGCFGNLTLDNRTIFIQKHFDGQQSPSVQSIEHIGTNDGCQLAEMETRTLRQYPRKDDLCSLYHPCYHGGVCASHSHQGGFSFTCNCLKPRFAGRQCQLDLQPCQSYPCAFDEQCISISSNDYNRSYSCISSRLTLPMSTSNPLYIGLAVTLCTLVLVLLLFLSLILYCQQERKDKHRKEDFQQDKPLVSAPLLIQKSSPTINTIESPMQTLIKFNQHNKQAVETLALVDKNSNSTTMNNFNDKQLNKSTHSIDKHQSSDSFSPRRNDSKTYSTIGRMNIPPENFLRHYNTIDCDQTREPLVEPLTNGLFDFPSSPTKYFNGHKEDSTHPYQVRINSLSDLTEKLAEHNDVELTHSSNDSSNNDQTLLTSPVAHGERKRRSLFSISGDHSTRNSTNSLSKTPVYAKIIKTSSKPLNGPMSTIERLRLSGSPLRLLSSSSPTYARTTSFLKATIDSPTRHLHANTSDNDTSHALSPLKTSKVSSISWKLNPRKLDSLKVRRNSRHTDEDDGTEQEDADIDYQHHQGKANNEKNLLTRLRHASDSDLHRDPSSGKKGTKLSSFFQTEV